MAVYQDLRTALPSYTVTPSGDPNAMNAQVTRNQWQLYQNRGVPMEDRIIAYGMDPNAAETEADLAGRDIANAFASTSRDADIALGRYGASMTAGQRATSARLRDLDKALAITGTKNEVRRSTRDYQTDLLGAVDQSMRGLSSSASSSLGSAAAMQTAREQAGKDARAQWKQNTMSTVMSGAGLGMAAAGPLGAGIGAGAGLLLTLL